MHPPRPKRRARLRPHVAARVSLPGVAAAFTLIELLAVVAIIGVLASLLLPAVQAARESARRAHCQNNLRQLGLALDEHESRRREFPIGCIGCLKPPAPPGQPAPPRRFISWNVQLLPELDETKLWRRFDFDVPSDSEPNRTLGATIVDVFICPSTPDATTAQLGNEWFEFEATLVSQKGRWAGQAFSDYGGVYGVEGHGRDAAPGARQLLADDSLGVLVYEDAVTAAQIEDGLSRTAAIAEALIRRQSDAEWTNGKNVFAHEGQTPLNVWSGLGNDIGSPHPGGASVAFCDGHVEFLSDGMDQTALVNLLTRAGDDAAPRGATP